MEKIKITKWTPYGTNSTGEECGSIDGYDIEESKKYIIQMNESNYRLLDLRHKDSEDEIAYSIEIPDSYVLDRVKRIFGGFEHLNRALTHANKELDKHRIQRLRDSDIQIYTTLKKSVKSLLLQLENDKTLDDDAAHLIYETIDRHQLDMTKLEIKFQSYTGRAIPGSECEETECEFCHGLGIIRTVGTITPTSCHECDGTGKIKLKTNL